MKKLLLITLLFLSLCAIAQNPTLFEKKWFLESVKIGNTNIPLPMDHFNFPFVTMNFYNTNSGLMGSSNQQMKTNCSSGFTSHLNYIGQGQINTSFNFIDITPSEVSSNCQTQDANMLSFMQVYKSFFLDNINDDFYYGVLDVYGIDHLKIWKANGDELWFTEVPNIVVNNELFIDDWALSKLIIDGNDLISPDFSAEGFDHIILDFKNYYTENIATGTGVHILDIENTFKFYDCNSNRAMINLFPNDNEFYLYNLGGTLSQCGNPSLNNYSNQHYNFYANNLPGAFSYTIQNSNGTEELTVINSIGNQAIYSRSVLSIGNNVINDINIYPNPTQKYLNIETNSKIKKVTLYNALGQKVMMTTKKIINISSLDKGLYFIKIVADNENYYRQKVIIEK